MFKKYTLSFIGNGLFIAIGLVFAAPSLSHAAITQTLATGSSGSEVRELQTFLAADATLYPEGLVTGYYGTLTQRAVERYQCTSNIVCSGTPATTGYGSVGPRTMASINAHMSGGGPSGGTSESGDVWAPIIGIETVTPTTNGAQISWSTNETATGRVMYGTTWPFLYATAASASAANIGTTHHVTLSGLLPSRQYYYVRESVDPSGNVQWTGVRTFTTP